MMQASQFIQVIEERQGLKIGCIEEVAFRKGFLSRERLEVRANKQLKSGYGQYLMNLLG
jgi:glucose-1-phosphate thymidylyltransferase